MKDKSGEFGSLAHYDYGFRIYNPSIGKFLSVDPLTKSYPMLTPYQFASNSPIEGIDLDGLEYTSSKNSIHTLSMGQVWIKTGKYVSGLDAHGNQYIGTSVPVLEYESPLKPKKFPLYSNSFNKQLNAFNLNLADKYEAIRKNKNGSFNNTQKGLISAYNKSQSKASLVGKGTGMLIALDLASAMYQSVNGYLNSTKISEERAWIKNTFDATYLAYIDGKIPDRYQNVENMTQIANFLFEGTLTKDEELNDIAKYIAKNYLDNLKPEYDETI